MTAPEEQRLWGLMMGTEGITPTNTLHFSKTTRQHSAQHTALMDLASVATFLVLQCLQQASSGSQKELSNRTEVETPTQETKELDSQVQGEASEQISYLSKEIEEDRPSLPGGRVMLPLSLQEGPKKPR